MSDVLAPGHPIHTPKKPNSLRAMGNAFRRSLICSFWVVKTSVETPRAARGYGFAHHKHAATLFFDRGRNGDRHLTGYVLSHAPP